MQEYSPYGLFKLLYKLLYFTCHSIKDYSILYNFCKYDSIFYM